MYCAQGQTRTLSKSLKDTGIVKVDSLKAAIVTATMRPRTHGDTVEFNTEHIVLQTNAVVEELLKRLPGLHIDPDGTITYNGEKIEHLLVDGEDIFESYPTLVTRNFDASKIARVQILDRKNDQAIFTGIDDGSRTKTLNLVLKESAKDGYFGKIDAGGSIKNYYNISSALAGFKDKEQFTALGIVSSVGTLNYSNSQGGGQASFLNGNLDPLGATAGTGIPRFDALALHYANTWDRPKDHLLANYQYSHYFTQPITSTQSFQVQSDSIYQQNQRNQSTNQQDQHWFYGTYEWVVGTRSAFRFIFHGNSSEGENEFKGAANSNFNDTIVNSSLRTIHDNLNRQSLGGIMMWRITIGKKPDRIFSVETNAVKTGNTTNGYLYSVNRFFQPSGLLESSDTVDQRKKFVSGSIVTECTINLAEPVWHGAVLGLSYKVSRSNDDPLQATYNDSNGKYDNLVDSLTSHFKTVETIQHGIISLQGKEGCLNYTIGSDLLGYDYHQQDVIAESILHFHNFNFAPRIFLNYNPNPTTSFEFRYFAYTQQPSGSQLEPAKNNDDPLHLTVGNPVLRPSFNQDLKFNFHRFKDWLINMSFDFAIKENDITQKTTTDSLGRQISEAVNVNGGGVGSFNFSILRKISRIDAGVHLLGTYARTKNYINSDLSQNDAYVGGIDLSLSKFVSNEYIFQVRTKFLYTDLISSVNTSAAQRYWSEDQQGSVTLYFFPNFEINTNADYTWQEKSSTFGSNVSVLMWNAYVSRNLLDNSRLVIKFQLNNILNQQAGISRSNTGNVYTESSTNILGRYWMLSAIYHFDKKFR